MWQKFKKLLEFYSKNGAFLPAAYDADKDGPSTTLLFTHIANATAIGSIIYLVTQDAKSGTISAIVYSVITMVLYLMRRIQSFKVDADDGELELSAGSEGVGPEENDEKAN